MHTTHIRPAARRNGLAFLVAGLSTTSASMALMAWFPFPADAIAIATLPAGLICTFIGWQKQFEPAESYTLSRDYIECHHRYGGWAIPWRDIGMAGVPTLSVALDYHPLDYVGIRLRNYDTLLGGVSPRLSSHLLQEQRSLLLAGFRGQYPGQSMPSDWVLEQDCFCSDAGRQYRGLVAMLGHRMRHLRKIYGFELLLPGDSLDRSPAAFARLLNEYRLAGLSSLESENVE